jgi:molecular chaperone GrpE (heat shock protein)
LRGINHPNFKTGRFSKDLPKGLRRKYDDAVTGEQFLSHAPELRLIDARTNELLESLNEPGDHQKTWKKILAQIEARRKLVDSEQRRLKDTGHMMSVEELLVVNDYLVKAVKSAIEAHTNPETQRKILSQVCKAIDTLMANPHGETGISK